MPAGAIVAVIVVIVVILAVAIFAASASRRSRLRKRFGPEYERLVSDQQSQRNRLHLLPIERSIGSSTDHRNLFTTRAVLKAGGQRAEKLISFTSFSFNFAMTSGSVSNRSSSTRDWRRRVLTE